MKWRDFWDLPAPTEVGFEDNYLRTTMFSPFGTGPTWEVDYDAAVRRLHPWRYFWMKRVVNPIYYGGCRVRRWFGEVLHWVQCMVWPSRYNFYRIDISNADPLHPNQWGYCDASEQIELACWGVLCRFAEDDVMYRPDASTEEDPDTKKMLENQTAHYDEVHELYKYWTVDRLVDAEKSEALFEVTEHCTSADEYSDAIRDWIKFDEVVLHRREEMLLRLIKIRRGLWS